MELPVVCAIRGELPQQSDPKPSTAAATICTYMDYSQI
jgi:hypothetical protein